MNNADMDYAAACLFYEQGTEEIREKLLSRGMSEYDAFLCFKAAQLLLSSGFYEESDVQ